MNFFVLVAAFVAGGAGGQQHTRAFDLPIGEGSANVESLRGSVRSVVTESARFAKTEGRWVEGGRVVVRRTAYNTAGAMTQSTSYLADGTEASRESYKLNAEAQPVEKLVYAAGSGTQSTRETYSYDDKGLMTEAVRYGRFDNVLERYSFRYDENGRLIEQVASPTEGSESIRTAMVYDDRGSLTARVDYDRAGNPETKHVYAYDGQRRVVSEKLYRPLGKHVYTKQFTYDAKGDVSKEVTYGGDGTLQARRTFKYTYDDTANWVKRVTYDTRAFRPVWLDVTYRTIAYYEEQLN